jgi:hypothetical protein
MKSDAIVKRHLRALRRLIDDDDTDVMTRRIAYEIECAIRWAREDTVKWETPVESAISGAALLASELARPAKRTA